MEVGFLNRYTAKFVALMVNTIKEKMEQCKSQYVYFRLPFCFTLLYSRPELGFLSYIQPLYPV